MKFMFLILGLSFQFILADKLHAGEDLVATVLLKKGDVKAKLADGSLIILTIDKKIPVGAVVQTAPNSFVKLIFSDKSQMNLGPSSQMLIQAFPRKEAGIIKLVKGQLRAEVTKNYMEMEDKSKSKLYIQTKTASMGIRGTDFQVNYNPANENSSLIVFEGKVAMGNIDRSMRDANLDQKKLEEIVSSSTAVMVRQGQFSAVNLNIAERPLQPTKLAPKQFDALKENTTGVDDPDSKRENKKQHRNIIPPGVDSAVFMNASPEIVKAEIQDAKGFFNEKSGDYKPAAGSIIDLKTVNLIAPAAGANYDTTTKTFIITQNYGKINEQSGQYIPPKGYELSNNGNFQPVSNDHVKEGIDAPTTKGEIKKVVTKEENSSNSSTAPSGASTSVSASAPTAIASAPATKIDSPMPSAAPVTKIDSPLPSATAPTPPPAAVIVPPPPISVPISNSVLVNTAPVNSSPINTAPVKTIPINTAPSTSTPVIPLPPPPISTVPLNPMPKTGTMTTQPVYKLPTTTTAPKLP
ncbi:MAG: FecR family protein [Bacteriovorax sp.]